MHNKMLIKVDTFNNTIFTEYLQQYCPKVERLGFDENFLDITDLVRDRLANPSGACATGVMGHVYGTEPSVLGNIIYILII